MFENCIKLILAAVILIGCQGRALCYLAAEDDYKAVIRQCKEDGKSFEECTEEKAAMAKFKKAQEACK